MFGLLLGGFASYYSLSSSKQILIAAAKRDLLFAEAAREINSTVAAA